MKKDKKWLFTSSFGTGMNDEPSKSDSKILEQIPELKLCYLSYNLQCYNIQWKWNLWSSKKLLPFQVNLWTFYDQYFSKLLGGLVLVLPK